MENFARTKQPTFFSHRTAAAFRDARIYLPPSTPLPATMPPPSSNKKKSKKDKKDRKHRKEGGGGHRGSGIDALVESGNEHIALDRVEEGLADLRKAHQLAPDSADAAEAYGMALAEYGDGATAVMILKRAAMVRGGRRAPLAIDSFSSRPPSVARRIHSILPPSAL